LVYARDLGVNGDFGVNLTFIDKGRVQLLRILAPPWRHSMPGRSPRGWKPSRSGSNATPLGDQMVGPYLGGMRALEWLVAHPERVATALMIVTTAASG
jgi:hypothetical protein